MLGYIDVRYYGNSSNECDDVEIYDWVSEKFTYIKGEYFKFDNIPMCGVILDRASIP